LYSVYSFFKSPEINKADPNRIELGKINELPENEFKTFKLGKTPGVLINNGNGELKALSTVCSHMQCTVKYLKDEKIFLCPCHSGKYDINGKNISGPPLQPLTEFKVMLIKQKIIVSRILK